MFPFKSEYRAYVVGIFFFFYSTLYPIMGEYQFQSVCMFLCLCVYVFSSTVVEIVKGTTCCALSLLALSCFQLFLSDTRSPLVMD